MITARSLGIRYDSYVFQVLVPLVWCITISRLVQFWRSQILIVLADSYFMGEAEIDSKGNPSVPDVGSVPGVTASFSTNDLICWGWQVAQGMEYLSRRNVQQWVIIWRNTMCYSNLLGYLDLLTLLESIQLAFCSEQVKPLKGFCCSYTLMFIINFQHMVIYFGFLSYICYSLLKSFILL